MRSFLFLSFFLSIQFCSIAQVNIIEEIIKDTSTIVTDSLNNKTPTEDSINVENSLAIDLIQKSQSEDITNSIKQDLLNEQLQSLQENDTKQRKLLESQLNELKYSDSIRKAYQQREIDSLKQKAIGAPVILNHDTILYIYTKLGSFTPTERANSNSEKITKAAKMFSLKNDSLIIIDTGTTSDIMYLGTTLMSITDTDALWVNSSRNELAKEYSQKIKTSIEKYKKNIGFLNILKMIGLCLLVIAIQYGVFKGINYLFRKIIDKKIIEKKDEWFTGIRIKTLEVINPERQVGIVLFISKIFRYFLYIVILYITIPVLFSIFPVTQRLAETLFGWVLTPIKSIFKSFINYLPNLLKIVIIIVVMHYIIRFLKYITKEIQNGKLVIPGFYADWAKSTFNILRIFLYAFTLVLVFPLLPESNSGVFQGVSVFIGVIFSLGSTNVIANLMAGMVITYMRPFIIGDRIKIGETLGDVIEKSPFVIRIKTHKNEIVTVPNSTVLSSNVINYSSNTEGDGLIINTTVSISYEVPWKQVNGLLIDAALKTEFILHTPTPFVLQTSLNDFTISYQICAYTKNPEKQALIYSQLHQNIHDIFDESGIELISPNYQAIRDGNKSTIGKKNE